MSYRIVSEPEFSARICEVLRGCCNVAAVTGPGRSGAVAAVYASHILGVPFIPYRATVPEKFKQRLLVIDTARWTGATIRKAGRLYPGARIITVYDEPPMVRFWYEARYWTDGADHATIKRT